MRRTSARTQRPYRSYDFLEDVDAERLRLIGAISIAWNWIEASIDASLSASLELHPDMWLAVTTRINGFDGKIALLKQYTRLYFNGLRDDVVLSVSKTLNAIEDLKRYRDGVIHIRLTHPDEITADIPVRRGQVHEVLVSKEALAALYGRLLILSRETDELLSLTYHRWLIMHTEDDNKRQQSATLFPVSLAQLQSHQSQREAMLPLPEFPDQPQEPQATVAVQ